MLTPVRGPYRRIAAVFVACTGLAASHAAAIDRSEVEPNNTKAQTDLNGIVALNPGDSVSGTSTGSSTTVPGIGSADYFHLKTGPQPLGIYRNTLSLSAVGVNNFVATLRGLNQTGGVITAGSDAIAQSAASLTNPPRTVAWYGFGKQEELYYRVHGTTMTTGSYTSLYSSTPVVPITVADTLFAGLVRISAAPTGGSAIDTDTWLYNAALDAVPGAGNDDVGGSPAGGPSTFTRTLAAGVYTLAVCPAQLSNNQPSPIDDDVRNGVCLDFPNAVLCSLVNGAGTTAMGTVNVTIDDFVHPPLVVPVTFSPGTIGDIAFIRFTLSTDPNPTGACCLTSGACTSATAVGCAAQAGSYQGDGVTCAGITCPLPGSCCDSGGCCTVTFQSACADRWTSAGVCVPNTCPSPLNDLCAGAVELTPGVRVFASNCTATSIGDGAAASCQNSAGKGVWFRFTPAIDGTYQLSACGSPQDTVLTIYSGIDCAALSEIDCDDDSCDGTTPPGSDLASVSRVLTFVNTATYFVRVASFGAAPAGGPFQIIVNPVISGACCAIATGQCTIGVGGVCSAGIYQGDGTLCSSNPCPPPGACCIGSCCTSSVQAFCSGVWTQGVSCTPNPCPVPVNDACGGAIDLVLGSPAMGDNCAATSTNDGPLASCQDLAAKGVWYRFMPSHSAVYRFATCGSSQDTVLQLFQSADCASLIALACDDDACDGVTPLGSTLASSIDSITLAANAEYRVRVSSFGAAPSGGPFTLLATARNILGACCSAAGSCTPTDGPSCSGTFTPDVACTPGLCTPPSGACCSGAICLITDAAACSGPDQQFAGLGTVCNSPPPPANNTSPCCIADFNHAGGTSVQDIFDFLAAYFANDPRADVNGSGISVQDIFDFLAAYFAGCP